MEYGIEGKTAVVTGADSGMGYITARLLLEEGASVVIADLDAGQIEKAASELKVYGPVHPVVVDVRDASSVEAFHATALTNSAISTCSSTPPA